MEQFIAVLGVFALLGAALWLLRSRGMVRFRTPSRRHREPGLEFHVVERLPLGPQHSLHVVRLADHVIVVATSPASCHRIAQFEWKDIAPGGRTSAAPL